MDKEKEEFCSTCHKGVNFFNQFLLLFSFKITVPFGKPRFARTVLNQDKLDWHDKYLIEWSYSGDLRYQSRQVLCSQFSSQNRTVRKNKTIISLS